MTASPGGDREFTLIVDGLKEVKEAVANLGRDMNLQMSRLVSQREFDRTRDDIVIDIGEVRADLVRAQAKHDGDIKSVFDAMQAAEIRRRTERWSAVGAFLTLAGLLVALLTHYT